MLDETDKAIKSYESTVFLGTAQKTQLVPSFRVSARKKSLPQATHRPNLSVLIWFLESGDLRDTETATGHQDQTRLSGGDVPLP